MLTVLQTRKFVKGFSPPKRGLKIVIIDGVPHLEVFASEADLLEGSTLFIDGLITNRQ